MIDFQQQTRRGKQYLLARQGAGSMSRRSSEPQRLCYASQKPSSGKRRPIWADPVLGGVLIILGIPLVPWGPIDTRSEMVSIALILAGSGLVLASLVHAVTKALKAKRE